MTREQAWAKALEEAVAHHLATTRRGKDSKQQMLNGLYTGLLEVRQRMDAGTVRTNDLNQLVACALDCLGAVIYDAVSRGEKPLRPDEFKQ